MRSWIVILYIIARKSKYRNGLNAALYIMIIHLSSIKPNIFKIRWEEANAHFTLIKHHIFGTMQGNSGTHSFPDIYIAPLQETYSEALSVLVRSKRNVFRSLQKEDTFFRGSKRSLRGNSFQDYVCCYCTFFTVKVLKRKIWENIWDMRKSS